MKAAPVSAAREIISAYREVLAVPAGEIAEVGVTVPIPRFCPDILVLLADEFVNGLRESRALVHVNSDAVVIGDLHWNVHNLLFILATYGMPPARKYVFLGNFIDYGEFSIEVTTLLFALRVMHPTSVCLLRGLSEHCPLNTINGLCEEIGNTYGSPDVWNAFKRAFTYLPLMCVLMDEICLCHLRMIANYPVALQVEELMLPIASKAEAYQEFTDVTDHLDHESCNTFCEINDFGFVICGGDSDCGAIQVTEDSKGFAISCCESDSDAAIFELKERKMNPVMFRTPKELLRANAKFVDLGIGIGTKHISSSKSEKNVAPQGEQPLSPTKSYV